MTAVVPALQHILLVEDEPGHALLVSEALQNHPNLRLHDVRNAVHAIHFMTKQQGYWDAPTPDLIILDLHLPIFSGKALLEELKIPGFLAIKGSDYDSTRRVYRDNP